MTETRPAIRVSEIFGPTVQGEGVLIGLPTVFIRTGGCDYRCSW
ncbi:MAG: 7-carboxy-7-deazaguanine synthase QueE, partial [Mesorhizobium sp.]